MGYWVGGALADRFPRPELLVAAIALGAAGVLAIPFLDEAVLEAVVGWDPGPRAEPAARLGAALRRCRASCWPR